MRRPKLRRAKPGRPSKLTPELQAKIVDIISAGNFREVAARYCRISDRTFQGWMARGAQTESGPQYEFFRAVIEAEQSAEIRAVAYVMRGGAKDPKHAEWWLERKHPRRWARRQPDEIPVGGDTLVQQVIFQLVSGTRPEGLLPKAIGAGRAIPSARDVPEAGRGDQRADAIQRDRGLDEERQDVRVYGLDPQASDGWQSGTEFLVGGPDLRPSG